MSDHAGSVAAAAEPRVASPEPHAAHATAPRSPPATASPRPDASASPGPRAHAPRPTPPSPVRRPSDHWHDARGNGDSQRGVPDRYSSAATPGRCSKRTDPANNSGLPSRSAATACQRPARGFRRPHDGSHSGFATTAAVRLRLAAALRWPAPWPRASPSDTPTRTGGHNTAVSSRPRRSTCRSFFSPPGNVPAEAATRSRLAAMVSSRSCRRNPEATSGGRPSSVKADRTAAHVAPNQVGLGIVCVGFGACVRSAVRRGPAS